MKITQLEQVLEVAKVGSISKAAMNLYITQPNLSQSIRKLEEEIGIPIFQRTNTGVTLSSFGMYFIANAKEVIMHMELLKDMCSINAEVRPIELNVASGGYLFLTKQLAELYKKYASNPISIRYFEATGARQIDLIRNNKAEIGFTSVWSYERRSLLKKFYSSGLEFHRLVDANPGIYVSKRSQFFSIDDSVVDLQKLKKMPYITTRQEEQYTSELFRLLFPDEKLADLRCSTRVFYVENSATMRDMLSVMDGFSLGSYCGTLYDKIGFYDNMRFIPFASDYFKCEIGWLQKSNTVRSVLVDELIGALQSNLL